MPNTNVIPFKKIYTKNNNDLENLLDDLSFSECKQIIKAGLFYADRSEKQQVEKLNSNITAKFDKDVKFINFSDLSVLQKQREELFIRLYKNALRRALTIDYSELEYTSKETSLEHWDSVAYGYLVGVIKNVLNILDGDFANI